MRLASCPWLHLSLTWNLEGRFTEVSVVVVVLSNWCSGASLLPPNSYFTVLMTKPLETIGHGAPARAKQSVQAYGSWSVGRRLMPGGMTLPFTSCPGGEAAFCVGSAGCWGGLGRPGETWGGLGRPCTSLFCCYYAGMTECADMGV